MRRITIIFILLIFALLNGCSIVPTVTPIPDGTGYEIPVVPGKIEAPDIIDDKPGPDMVITVQPETPGEQPVKIQVRKVKRTIAEKLLTNKPEYEVKSDSGKVSAVQQKKTLWWRWLLAAVLCLFILAAAVMVIVNKVSSWSPAGFIKNLFRRG